MRRKALHPMPKPFKVNLHDRGIREAAVEHLRDTPERREPVVVKLTRNEISFDVDFESSKIAQMTFMDEKKRTTTAMGSKAHTGKDTKDWLDRQIETAMGALSSSCRAYIIRKESRMTMDTIDPDVNEWTLSLEMPRGWRGEPSNLNKFAHNYVVDYAIGEWFDMIDGHTADKYKERAEKDMRQFKNELDMMIVGTQYFVI